MQRRKQKKNKPIYINVQKLREDLVSLVASCPIPSSGVGDGLTLELVAKYCDDELIDEYIYVYGEKAIKPYEVKQ